MVWVVAVLGACFVFIRAGLGDAPVLWFAAIRALTGGVVLAGLALAQRRPLPRRKGGWGPVIAGLGLANGTFVSALMFPGVVHLSTGVASVVANAQPLLIVDLSACWWRYACQAVLAHLRPGPCTDVRAEPTDRGVAASAP